MYSHQEKSSFYLSEKEHLLQTLKRLDIFSPQKRNNIQKHLPFFDKALLPLIDYLTIWDLLQLAGYDDNDVPLLAVLIGMFDTLQEGSLCQNLEKSSLIKRLQAFASPEDASDMAEKFLAGLENHRYDDFISWDQDQYKPLVISSHKNKQLLYFQKYYVYEKKLRKKIRQLLNMPVPTASRPMEKSAVDKLIEDVYSPGLVLRTSEGGPPIARDVYQIEAIKKALSNIFCIVSGGPGTGKTSLMVNLLRCFVRTGVDCSQIILCAPTGRAAQRMTEAIYKNIKTIRVSDENDTRLLSLKGSTIHKALHFKRYLNGFYYREQNPLPASLIIMDEVSMVDVSLMEKFMRAIDPEKTRLILLGDKDQLPSVEAGAIFGTMIPQNERSTAFKNHLVVLKTVYRSGENLQQLAGMINEGKSPAIEPVTFPEAMDTENDSWSMVYPETLDQWQKDLIRWADRYLIKKSANRLSHVDSNETGHETGDLEPASFHSIILAAGALDSHELIRSLSGQKLLENIFQTMESSKILTLIRQGIWGSEGVNRFLSEYLSHRFHSLPDWQKHGIFSGAFIIIVQNDYAKALFNGDTGVVIKDPQGLFRAFFRRFDTFVEYSLDLLPAWQPAYALTVHKCQGSEFDDILLVLPADEQHRLLTRQMTYTAVTRAKKKVIIYGKASSFKTALKNKIHRESGLLW